MSATSAASQETRKPDTADRYSTRPHERDPHKIIVLDHENASVRDVNICGTRLYVRQCEVAQASGGIIVPDKSRDETNFVTILGIGKGCGTQIDKNAKEFRKSYKIVTLGERNDKFVVDRVAGIVSSWRVKDRILCPCRRNEWTWGVEPSPWNFYEFFIDERLVWALWSDDARRNDINSET